MFWYIQNAVLFTWAARLELVGGGSAHGGGLEADPEVGGDAGGEEGRSAASRADPWQRRDWVVRLRRREKSGAVRRPTQELAGAG